MLVEDEEHLLKQAILKGGLLLVAGAHLQGAHNNQRRRRKEDERERDGVVSAGKETFLDTFQKNIYGAGQSGDKASSLQDAIGRRKFYSQR